MSFIAPLIGAAGGIFSSILGGNAESEAAEKNWQINLMNYYARERERSDAQFQAMGATAEARADKYLARKDATEARDYSIKEAAEAKKYALEDREEAKRLSAEDRSNSKLGTTDANGNRSYFKEGVGWVSELSPIQQALQEKYSREENAVLDNDLVKQRELFNNNVERQKTEGREADSLLWMMKNVRRGSDSDLENEMNGATSKGIEAGFGSALEDAMRSALRTGASNSGKVAADIGRERSKALIEAFMQNKLSSRGSSDKIYADERANYGNLYNSFASRASADPNIAYNPRNVDGAANQQLAGVSGRGVASTGGTVSGTQSALLNAFANQGNASGKTLQFADGTQAAMANQIKTAGMQGGTLGYVQPNNGMANMFGGIGSSISGAVANYQSENNLQRALQERYKQGSGLF